MSLIDANGEWHFTPARSLYIHVPFCFSKCTYCDFFSIPSPDLNPEISRSIVEKTLCRASMLASRFATPPGLRHDMTLVSSRDVSMIAEDLSHTVPKGCKNSGPSSRFDTVYVGGGTPTHLDRTAFRSLLEGIVVICEGKPDEWTVEANPESLDESSLCIMKSLGVTRISLGIQSLDDSVLLRLGRATDAKTALNALHMAVKAGFEVSADLMTGLPCTSGPGSSYGGKTFPDSEFPLKDQIQVLLESGICHLSLYDLVLETGTPLAKTVKAGKLILPDEDSAFEERELAERNMKSAGFYRYEVSNYAKLGHECRHNMAYWNMDSYIGAGPGAVSTIQSCDPGSKPASIRISEPQTLDEERTVAVEESLDSREAAFEMLMMGMRISKGLDCQRFISRFGILPENLWSRTLEKWQSSIHVVKGQRIFADNDGLDMLNAFLTDCLTEMEDKKVSTTLLSD